MTMTMTMTMTCPTCGQNGMHPQIHRHVERVGPYKVNDATGMALGCDFCGEFIISDEQVECYELRAAAIVLREKTNPEGAVIRYARKALGLKQTEFGALLNVASETVSRWENGHDEVSITHRMAMVGYLDGVANGTVDLRKMLS